MKKPSLAQQAANTLFEMIADDGYWRPGDQLPNETCRPSWASAGPPCGRPSASWPPRAS